MKPTKGSEVVYLSTARVVVAAVVVVVLRLLVVVVVAAAVAGAGAKKSALVSSSSAGRGCGVRTQKWMDWITASAKSSPSQNFDVFSLQEPAETSGFGGRAARAFTMIRFRFMGFASQDEPKWPDVHSATRSQSAHLFNSTTKGRLQLPKP